MSAVQSPSRQASRARSWWRDLGRGWKGVLSALGALAAVATIVTSWIAIFPHHAAITPGASFEVDVEPMTRQEYKADQQSRGGATAAVGGDSFAVYVVPVADGAEGLVPVSFTEEAAAEEQKIKEEGEKIKEEAKRDEEDSAQEEASATAEQKAAETTVHEEQQKEQEAQKRAEESQTQDAAKAAVEEAKAQDAQQQAEKASETVQVKKRDSVRSPTQRRIERGTPASQVEAVLREAGEPERCQSTCALKPAVEKALKDKSGNTGKAAREVHGLAASNFGARLSFRVTLNGLAHKLVFLTYVILQEGREPPPPGSYEGEWPVGTVTPTNEHEPVVGHRWVPVPPSSQEYHLRLVVSDSKQEEVSLHDTSPFQ
jgi:hypothetical protein